jgi:RHS repeat-associated protein
VTYQYDAANRLIEAGCVSYTWDANGNLLSDVTSTYTYNFAKCLEGVTQDGVAYSYAYNGMGDRLQQSVDGVTTNYTLDLNTGLTQVLADGSNTYLYGRSRIAQVNAGTPEHFLGDALGSVRQVTDPAAEAVLSRSYQPYGEVLNQYGDGGTHYGFTGEWVDQTGLIHLRARLYDPNQGRLLTRDVWRGNNQQPMSFHDWLYGFANPTMFIDPSGYQGECPDCVPTPAPHPSPTPTLTPTPVDKSMNKCGIGNATSAEQVLNNWMISITPITTQTPPIPETWRTPTPVPVIEIDLSKLDYLELANDIGGIAGDVVLILQPQGIGEAAEAVIGYIE